jgi:hypothetical protein
VSPIIVEVTSAITFTGSCNITVDYTDQDGNSGSTAASQSPSVLFWRSSSKKARCPYQTLRSRYRSIRAACASAGLTRANSFCKLQPSMRFFRSP